MVRTTARHEPVARIWHTFAACRDVDPELFFPVTTTGATFERQVATAKAVCAGCPVITECFVEAFELLPHGIAGGLTPEERRASRWHQIDIRTDFDLPASTRSENAAIGAALLATGRSPASVARRCRVTERTVYRWKAAAAAKRRAEG
ncbi:hypothetical protein GCM10017691_63750 [Pseudonocardia petroleophila]|uniref:WhiB family transcriptional regulator n=1 Tax=Pseudonocardia petroleophila TaxID=37331 RepID=A0A7G7MKH7_9PSEU|nr:WhiB family transcriptional regulator [Pseudonocardia petroleophila]